MDVESMSNIRVVQYKTQQQIYMKDTVMKMLSTYYHTTKEIHENELDQGVIDLCARHTTSIVQMALERYITTGGRNMDNPSAYLSFLLTKFSSNPQAFTTATTTTT
jgi:hypothetical protein